MNTRTCSRFPRTKFANAPLQLRFLLQCGVLALLAMGLTGSVQAQSPHSPTPMLEGGEKSNVVSIWHEKFGAQTGRLLKEETSRSVREVSLRNIVILANKHSNELDLYRAVDPLVHVIEAASSPQHRLMAVQALSSIVIGAEETANDLYREAITRVKEVMHDDPSKQVRRAAAGLASQVEEEA